MRDRQTLLATLTACLTLFAACATVPARAGDAPRLSRAENALLSAEKQRFDAQVARDIAALKLSMASEAVYTHANGRVQTREEYLHDLETGAAGYRSIDIIEQVPRIYGNVGLTHGSLTLNVAADRRLPVRYTGVYIRRAGRWQLLAWHATSAPEER